MRRFLSLVLLLPLLPLTGCGEENSYDPWYTAIDAQDRYEPDEVVLRIGNEGGFTTVEYQATRLPTVTVYGDGRVITPSVDIRPSPALPNILVRTIGDEAVRDLVRRALQAGVGYREHYSNPLVADADTTRFTVLTTAGELVTTVYALGMVNPDRPEDRDDHQRLSDLRDALTDLPTTLGADIAGEEQPYEPAALAAFTGPYTATDDLEQAEKVWPGPALPGEAAFAGLGCVTVTGDDLAAVLGEAETATVRTPWLWAGQTYSVWFRPLLPDESTCSDL